MFVNYTIAGFDGEKVNPYSHFKKSTYITKGTKVSDFVEEIRSKYPDLPPQQILIRNIEGEKLNLDTLLISKDLLISFASTPSLELVRYHTLEGESFTVKIELHHTVGNLLDKIPSPYMGSSLEAYYRGVLQKRNTILGNLDLRFSLLVKHRTGYLPGERAFVYINSNQKVKVIYDQGQETVADLEQQIGGPDDEVIILSQGKYVSRDLDMYDFKRLPAVEIFVRTKKRTFPLAEKVIPGGGATVTFQNLHSPTVTTVTVSFTASIFQVKVLLAERYVCHPFDLTLLDSSYREYSDLEHISLLVNASLHGVPFAANKRSKWIRLSAHTKLLGKKASSGLRRYERFPESTVGNLLNDLMKKEMFQLVYEDVPYDEDLVLSTDSDIEKRNLTILERTGYNFRTGIFTDQYLRQAQMEDDETVFDLINKLNKSTDYKVSLFGLVVMSVIHDGRVVDERVEINKTITELRRHPQVSIMEVNRNIVDFSYTLVNRDLVTKHVITLPLDSKVGELKFLIRRERSLSKQLEARFKNSVIRDSYPIRHLLSHLDELNLFVVDN